jgi:hypothetical protein
MRKVLILAKICFLLMIAGIFVKYLFFAENVQESRYKETRQLEKQYLGGIVLNNSSKTIKIVDNQIIKPLNRGESSRQAGIFDADGIVVEYPVIFEGKRYNSGAIKICDWASIEVNYDKEKGANVIKPSVAYNFCSLLEKVGWFNSFNDAFGRKY